MINLISVYFCYPSNHCRLLHFTRSSAQRNLLRLFPISGEIVFIVHRSNLNTQPNHTSTWLRNIHPHFINYGGWTPHTPLLFCGKWGRFRPHKLALTIYIYVLKKNSSRKKQFLCLHIFWILLIELQCLHPSSHDIPLNINAEILIFATISCKQCYPHSTFRLFCECGRRCIINSKYLTHDGVHEANQL